jgi:hypothetical protein
VLLVPMMLTVFVGHHASPSATTVLFWGLPWWRLLWLILMGVLGGGIALSGSLLVLVVLPLGAVFEVIRPWRAAQRAARQRERASLLRRLSLILVSMVLVGCTTAPMAPNIAVYPMKGSTLEQYAADDARCREFAAAQLGTSPEREALKSAAVTGGMGQPLGGPRAH